MGFPPYFIFWSLFSKPDPSLKSLPWEIIGFEVLDGFWASTLPGEMFPKGVKDPIRGCAAEFRFWPDVLPILARCPTNRRPPRLPKPPSTGHFGKSERFGDGPGRRPSTHFGTASTIGPPGGWYNLTASAGRNYHNLLGLSRFLPPTSCGGLAG